MKPASERFTKNEGPRRDRARRWLPNIGLLLLTTALMLAIGELVLRRSYERRYRSYPKNSVTRMTTPEYDVEIRINARGFRDRDHALEKPKGSVRIAVLGDSFTWGSGVEAPEIFTSRLESLLRERTSIPDLEVFNYGVTWTGPVYYKKVFDAAAAPYEPDIVVVAVYAGNDVADALRESRQPMPRVASVALLRELRNRPKSGGTPAFGWAAQQDENPATLPALLRVGARAGVPADTITARYNAISESLRADALAYRVNPFNLAEAVTDPESVRENLLLEGEEMEEAWRATEKALADLERAIERRRARMVLVVIPAAAQVGKQYWWVERLGFRLDERLLTETPVQDRIARFAAARGVPYVDPLPALRARRDSMLYFEQDGHWTPAAHEIAARAIAERIAGEIAAGVGTAR